MTFDPNDTSLKGFDRRQQVTYCRVDLNKCWVYDPYESHRGCCCYLINWVFKILIFYPKTFWLIWHALCSIVYHFIFHYKKITVSLYPCVLFHLNGTSIPKRGFFWLQIKKIFFNFKFLGDQLVFNQDQSNFEIRYFFPHFPNWIRFLFCFSICVLYFLSITHVSLK